jgi:multidrug efflux pump subunit AcrB
VDPTGETRYVRVRLPAGARENPADLARIPIVLPSATGVPTVLPLSQVATITPGTGPAQIDHADRARVVTVGANTEGSRWAT